MEKKIVASIIAVSQKELDERVNKINNVVSIIQLDIMDGKFAPEKSLNFDFKLPELKCEIEADLMVQNPEKWIQENYQKVDTIIVHIESVKDILSIIKLIKSKGKKAVIALDPITIPTQVIPYINEVDGIMVFTAKQIGYYGAPFNPKSLEKVRNLKLLKPTLNIEADGGVNMDNIKMISDSGVDMFVSGSYIQNNNNPKKAVEELLRTIK
jgi:ribulose-phosphate 3-epimerase